MDYTVNPQHRIDDASGTSIFSNGKDALVTFAGQGATPNQIFLVSQETKQLIPFSSMQSAMNYFSTVTGGQVTPEEINASLTQIPPSSLAVGQSLNGFVPVAMANGFDEEGRLTNPAPSNANIQARYNKNIDQAAEMKAYTALDGFTKLLNSAGVGSTVAPAEVSKLISDPTTMGFYINALAYGGYTLQDIYQDMVRQQAIDNGQGSKVMNSFPISTSQPASIYKSGLNYQNVKNNPALQVSPSIAGIDSSMLNNPVLQLPDEAFKLISPLSNPDSPEFRSQMEQYKSATYQIALEMSQSTNETEHAKAAADWASLKEQIQSRLGVTLSDNAIQAWNQLDNFTAQAGMNNLSGSGMVEQKIDDFLKQQASANQSMRKFYQTYEDSAKESYYQNYASPTEIAQLAASDPQKAQAWGLVPNDATKQYMTIGNLQQLFPNTPAADLQAIINKYVDAGGNNYSKLYASYAANQYDITGQQNVAAATDVMQASQNKAGEALAKYSDPNNPFLKPGESNIVQPQLPSAATAATPTAAAASEALSRSAATAAKISSNLASTTPTQPQAQAQAPVIPNKPTPPDNMNAAQQSAWNNALAQIPKTTPTPTPTPATPASFGNLTANASYANANNAPLPVQNSTPIPKTVAPVKKTTTPVKPLASTAPVGVLAPAKTTAAQPWSLQSFGNTIKGLFGF